MITSATEAGSICARQRASLTTPTPRSTAGSEASEPRKLPIGVRAAEIRGAELSVEASTIQRGRYWRKIQNLEWLRPNIVRIRGRAKFRSEADIITLYPGNRLPPVIDLRRRRRAFQAQLGKALCAYFGVRRF